MSIKISAAHDLMAKALDYRSVRQDMISSNIANTDTPFYRPRDISFENVLAEQKAKNYNQNDSRLQMAQTDPAHLPLSDEKSSNKATTFFRDGHLARNDGNSVDLDIETTEMSKNSIMFSALISAIKKDEANFKNVIDTSSKAN